MQCLLAFVESSDMELSLQALSRLGACADHLAKGDLHIVPPVRLGSNHKRGDGRSFDPIRRLNWSDEAFALGRWMLR